MLSRAITVLLPTASALVAPNGAIGGDELKRSVPAAAARHTPMEALVDAFLAFAPDAGSAGSPKIEVLRAKSSPVLWKESGSTKNEGRRSVGGLAGGTVTIPNSATVWELTVDWFAPEGRPFGFDPIKALKAKGFRVLALYCAPMISEGTNYFFVAAPGKRPAFLSIYAFDAPTATSVADWSISYRLDGYFPSLAEVQKDDALATTDCSSQPFERVDQISRTEALAIAKMTKSGAAH